LSDTTTTASVKDYRFNIGEVVGVYRGEGTNVYSVKEDVTLEGAMSTASGSVILASFVAAYLAF